MPLSADGPGAIGYKVETGVSELVVSFADMPREYDAYGPQDVQAAYTGGAGSEVITAVKGGKDIRVFFDTHGSNPHSADPNWFFYWTQTQPVLNAIAALPQVTVIDVAGGCVPVQQPLGVRLVYDPSFAYLPPMQGVRGVEPMAGTGRGGTMSGLARSAQARDVTANSSCAAAGITGVVVTSYDPVTISLGPGAVLHRSKVSGYENFLRTVVHEIEHVRMQIESYAPSGTRQDTDGDGYDDSWEANPANYAQYLPSGVNFRVGRDDSYSNQYARNGCVANSSAASPPVFGRGAANCSAGTLYEEMRARTVAANLTMGAVSSYDWSYGHTKVTVANQLGTPVQLFSTSSQW